METSVETRMLRGMLLGAHESVAGGPHTAIARGRADGCEAIQIFARPSAQWRAKPFLPEEVSLFRSEHATVGWPTLSHASYLINLAAGDPAILDKSRDALADEMFRAEELGLDFVVLHPGAHVGAGVADGVEAAADSLSELDARTRGMRVRLLLEITAGQGSCLGCRFEEMEAMLAARPGRRPDRDLLRHLPRPRLRLRPQHRGGLRAHLRRLRAGHRARQAAGLPPQRLEDPDRQPRRPPRRDRRRLPRPPALLAPGERRALCDHAGGAGDAVGA